MNDQGYYELYWSKGGYGHNAQTDGAPEPLRSLFQRYVHPSDHTLDLGCGDGGTSGVYLSEHARSYVGVDVSEAAVELAEGRGLTAMQIETAAALPFAAGSFDVVVCSEVLEHLFEPHLAVAEAFRVLRPGGRMIVTVPNVAYWRDRVDALLGIWQPGGDDRGRAEPWRSPHVRFFRPATLKRLLGEAGFDDVAVIGLPSPLLGSVPVLRNLIAGAPGRGSRAAARVWPSLFAGGVGAVAKRGAATGRPAHEQSPQLPVREPGSRPITRPITGSSEDPASLPAASRR
jgi:SAM-dependent methyltransferase